mmetsp:Transcript_30199/g.100911  ORF Transcript_30199/g.100911 Transcript_30199/m.100911 type:complete len:231 (+) Transcript_30199:563-1255(+)
MPASAAVDRKDLSQLGQTLRDEAAVVRLIVVQVVHCRPFVERPPRIEGGAQAGVRVEAHPVLHVRGHGASLKQVAKEEADHVHVPPRRAMRMPAVGPPRRGGGRRQVEVWRESSELVLDGACGTSNRPDGVDHGTLVCARVAISGVVEDSDLTPVRVVQIAKRPEGAHCGIPLPGRRHKDDYHGVIPASSCVAGRTARVHLASLGHWRKRWRHGHCYRHWHQLDPLVGKR